MNDRPIDWELSTIGHPMSDLANLCLAYHHRPLVGPSAFFDGYGVLDPSGDSGVPSEEEVQRAYCSAAGVRFPIPDWSFFLAFALFRISVITQGVAIRRRAG